MARDANRANKAGSLCACRAGQGCAGHEVSDTNCTDDVPEDVPEELPGGRPGGLSGAVPREDDEAPAKFFGRPHLNDTMFIEHR